jgi:aryl-alcohol dehydrogenase-like predicted oxidoreductase
MRSLQVMLGTAQWGWTTDSKTAYEILDCWLDSGNTHIDTATNYPINKNPADFRAAEKILSAYIQSNGLKNLRITVKVGSVDNLRTPENNLKPSFLRMLGEAYLQIFGENLAVLMVHWDNRSDPMSIAATLEALVALNAEYGFRIGLSGIARPDVYCEVINRLDLHLDVQVKHNVFHSDVQRYQELFYPNHHFWAYGIMGGGVSLEEKQGITLTARGGLSEQQAHVVYKINEKRSQWNTAQVRPPITTMNQVGLLFAYANPALSGILLGASTTTQVQATFNALRDIEEFDYSDVYKDLVKISS